VSLEVLLIPAALAAISAWRAHAEKLDHGTAAVVQTRLRDEGLLTEAVTNLGGQALRTPAGLTAEIEGGRITFTTNAEGLAVAHVEGIDARSAEEVIRRIDAEYAAQVQTRLYDRLKARAAELGLLVESEHVDADNNITVVLQTNDRVLA